MFIYDDNFLTEEDIRKIEDSFFAMNVLWQYRKFTQDDQNGNLSVDHIGVVNTGTKDVPYFTAAFDPKNSPEQYDIFKYLIDKFTKKHGIEYKDIGRVKANITPWTDDQHTLYPHIDGHYKHLIFLYYVIDSDGDTFLYNERLGDTKHNEVTVWKRIAPKRGAAFIVDGEHYHSITPPTNHPIRCVINSNLLL